MSIAERIVLSSASSNSSFGRDSPLLDLCVCGWWLVAHSFIAQVSS